MKAIPRIHLTTASLLALLATSGCKSSNTPATSNSGPAVGSSYTYHVTEYNPDGSISQQKDKTVTVTSIDSSWNGKSNVVIFDNGGGLAFVYESNGDITSFVKEKQDHAIQPLWIRMPLSGSMGVTVIFSNHPPLDYDAMMTKYTGSGTDTVAGIALAIQKVRLTDTTARMTGLTSTNYISTTNYSFAPSIHEMTRVDASGWTDAVSGERHGRTLAVLTGYSLELPHKSWKLSLKAPWN